VSLTGAPRSIRLVAIISRLVSLRLCSNVCFAAAGPLSAMSYSFRCTAGGAGAVARPQLPAWELRDCRIAPSASPVIQQTLPQMFGVPPDCLSQSLALVRHRLKDPPMARSSARSRPPTLRQHKLQYCLRTGKKHEDFRLEADIPRRYDPSSMAFAKRTRMPLRDLTNDHVTAVVFLAHYSAFCLGDW